MLSIKTANKKLLTGLKIVLLAVLLLPYMQLAAHADNVVEGYSSKDPLQPGEVVAIDNASKRTVKVAPADNTNVLYGVVVDPSDVPITLVGDNTKVFVAKTGTYQVLVSTSNGSIKQGDYISMSTTNGIAGKARVDEPMILGKAASSFNGTTNVISNTGGVTIGKIYIDLNLQKNPIASQDPSVPGFLRKVTDSISNKSVPVIRIYTALAIFIISLVASIVILWSGVRSSLISLGRNPLSRHAIFSGMYKVVFTGIGVFIIGVAGVYLLLKV